MGVGSHQPGDPPGMLFGMRGIHCILFFPKCALRPTRKLYETSP